MDLKVIREMHADGCYEEDGFLRQRLIKDGETPDLEVETLTEIVEFLLAAVDHSESKVVDLSARLLILNGKEIE